MKPKFPYRNHRLKSTQQHLNGSSHRSSHPNGTPLSIVVPVYNEEEVLPTFHGRLSAVLNSMPLDAEVLYVNDGSNDDSVKVMERLREDDRRVAILELSRNFGKEIAITAGLDHAKGEAVIIIDADLQDPPELIPEMVRYWKNGYDVVNARRTKRHGETLLKRITAYVFYRMMKKLGSVDIPEDTGDFRLFSRRAVDALKQLRETHRFMKGLFTWIGYPQKEITYQRDPRHTGKTKWNYFRLWNFALEGFTSFSIAPLKIATYFGLIITIGALLNAVLLFYRMLFYEEPIRGYPLLMVIILFLGGVQLISIGIIGEYLGRVFNETKQRPLYFIKAYDPPRSSEIVQKG